ncbi:MAG: carbohydrate ABC transporter permease [Halolamina sp.]
MKRLVGRLPPRLRRRIRDATGHAPDELLVRGGVLLALLSSAAFFVVPLYWLLSAAFRSPEGMSIPPRLVPVEPSIHHLVAVLETTPFVTYFVNSLVVSAATVLLTLAVATPAAYALAWYDVPLRRHLMVVLLVVQMIPVIAMVIPLYRLFALLSLLDTLAVLVVANTVLVVPVAIWLLTGYFDTLPAGLEEAARVGGASRIRAFGVIVPLARPALSAVSLYAFVVSWNQFVLPLTFTSSRAVRTVPLGLYGFVSRYGVVDWGLLGAASLLAVLPVLVLFALFQNQFLAGVVGSGYGR